jgi:hypothetical protein
MGLPNEILNQFPPEIQPPIKQMGEWLHDNTIPREDFTSLRSVVQDLSESLRETKQTVKELAEAQKQTEHRVEELAQAQKRTEHRVEELAIALKELAEAQKRTEQRVEELAEAQKRTELRVEELAIAMKEGFQKINNQISALGGRWGIKNEITFRNTISALLSKAGYSVSRGYYGDREVDVVIKNGEHILLEITSAALKKDVRSLNLSADDYFQKTGIQPLLMIAATYVSPSVMREIIDSPRKIEIYSGEEEEE